MQQMYTESDYQKIKQAVVAQKEGFDDCWLYNVEVNNDKFDILVEMNDFKFQVDYVNACSLILVEGFLERSDELDEKSLLNFVAVMQHQILG